MLSSKCDQSCSYCDLKNFHKNHQKMIEADLDYFKYCISKLSSLTDNLMIELTGGEPGLISNLSDFIEVLKQENSVVKTQLMSNGLVRKNHDDLYKEFDSYNEHLISDIKDTEITMFHDLELIDLVNGRSVVVLNKSTTNALLDNFEYFNEMGLFNEDKFWLKMFVERSITNDHTNQIIELFEKIDTSYAHYCITQLTVDDDFSQAICSIYPWQPVINIENKKIIHCAFHNFSNQILVNCTDENMIKLINNDLFRTTDLRLYCKNCYLYNRNKNRFKSIRHKQNS